MELCSTLDKHESVHSHLHAGKFAYRGRNELVAGHTYDISWEYNRSFTDDFKWTCRSEIWNSISGFGEGKFWCDGSEYSCATESNCRMRMVWYSDLDRRVCSIPNDSCLVPSY